MRLSRAWACGAAAAIAAGAAFAAHGLAPVPSADVSRGSEEAFAKGLHRRELPPRRPPQRWTMERASFTFFDLPRGPARLEVRVHSHRTPVTVVSGGVVLGVLEPGTNAGDYLLPQPLRSRLDVVLATEGFRPGADARRLGTLLDRVTILHAPARWPAPRLLLSFVVPALAFCLAGLAAGLAPAAAVAIAAGAAALQAAALLPCGVVRSAYAGTLSASLVFAAALAAAFARFWERRRPGAGGWAFVALLAAVLVQGVAATSPLMVVSDVVMHANKLEAVAGGDFFPTSLTQHARPFRFPYGVSFYALLAPLARAGADEVFLVRAGAASAGIAASAALFALLAASGAARAAAAVLVLQLLPGAFDLYSFGNLSNVFGHAATVLFFAWWAGGAPGGRWAGAALVAVGSLAHLSSLIVLAALAASLVVARREEIAGDRARLLALGIGFGIAALYYLQFSGLVASQLPRLLEGGGSGRGASVGAWAALRAQVLGALAQWGWPALLLALLGRPGRAGLDRDLRAFWVAGFALALPAVLTPLEVRYLYALTLPLSVAAAGGLLHLASRGLAARAAAIALLGWQAVLFSRTLAEAVLLRYRP